ncbi:unnamed protein product [Amoebophrya sp. A25]|nr:unnamed protein product [Amoebophrya sp. A25]|eukprot:GSA25T00009797001.1
MVPVGDREAVASLRPSGGHERDEERSENQGQSEFELPLKSHQSISKMQQQPTERKRDKMRHSIYDMAYVAWEASTARNLLPVGCYFLLVYALLTFCRYVEFDLWKFLIKKRYRNTIYMWFLHCFIAVVTCKYYFNRRVRDVLKGWVRFCVVLERNEYPSERHQEGADSSTKAPQDSTCVPSSVDDTMMEQQDVEHLSRVSSSASLVSSSASGAASSASSIMMRVNEDEQGVKGQQDHGADSDDASVKKVTRINFFAAVHMLCILTCIQWTFVIVVFATTVTIVPLYWFLVDQVWYAVSWFCRRTIAKMRRVGEAEREVEAPRESGVLGHSDERQVVVDYPASTKALWMTEETQRLLKLQNRTLPTKRLRILLVCEYAPCEFHGMAVRLKNLVKELSKHHDVRILTSRSKEQLQKEGFNDIATIELYREMGVCLQNMWNPGNKVWISPNLGLVESFFDFTPDVVHIFYPCVVGLPIFLLSHLLDVPIYCSHHVDMSYYMDKYFTFALWQRMSHWWFSWSVRLPAYIFADINVAPTNNALDKEFDILYRNKVFQKFLSFCRNMGCMALPDESCVYNSCDHENTQGPGQSSFAPTLQGLDATEQQQHYAESVDGDDVDSSRASTTSSQAGEDSLDAAVDDSRAPSPLVESCFRSRSRSTITSSRRGSFSSTPENGADQRPVSSPARGEAADSPSTTISVNGTVRPSMIARTTKNLHDVFLCVSQPESDEHTQSREEHVAHRTSTSTLVPGPRAEAYKLLTSSLLRKLPDEAMDDRMTASTYSGQSSSNHSWTSTGSYLKRLRRGPTFNFSEYIIPTAVGSIFKSDTERKCDRNIIRANCNIHEEAKIILMVQRIAPEKRVEMAIRQMPHLVGKYHLVIVGNGPSYRDCVGLTQELYGAERDAFEKHDFRFDIFEEAASAVHVLEKEAEDAVRGDACCNEEKVSSKSTTASSSSSSSEMNENEAPASTSALARTKRNELNVTFLGMQSNEKLPLLYQNADFFLSCAVSETFGITVIEALSCNLVPILAHCQVFEELYQASPFISECMFHDGAQLLSTLDRLYTTRIPTGEELRYQLRDSIYFSWDRAAEALVDQYRQVMCFRKAFS